MRETARLTHPNTITVFDYGRNPAGIFYYAMELLDGRTLKELVEATGAQPPERVAHVLRAVAGALREALDACSVGPWTGERAAAWWRENAAKLPPRARGEAPPGERTLSFEAR